MGATARKIVKPAVRARLKQWFTVHVPTYRAFRLTAIERGDTLATAIRLAMELYVEHNARWLRFLASEVPHHHIARRRGRVDASELDASTRDSTDK
jgi:hypothetical protein